MTFVYSHGHSFLLTRTIKFICIFLKELILKVFNDYVSITRVICNKMRCEDVINVDMTFINS
jgi:hypothetical protein